MAISISLHAILQDLLLKTMEEYALKNSGKSVLCLGN
jgi:hypothetical protein